MCELASPAPILSAVLIRAVKEGLVKAREPLLSSGLTGDLQVGMLVRVIGEVIDAKYNGGPLRMLASKIGKPSIVSWSCSTAVTWRMLILPHPTRLLPCRIDCGSERRSSASSYRRSTPRGSV